MSESGLVPILEGALMAAGEPVSLLRLAQLFDDTERPSNEDIREALAEVTARCEGRGFELIQVASGYRFQVRQHLAPWVGRLWQERPQKYSRALLETLSLIAYRQPITRGEIEEVRGVAVSSNIVKMLLEREWVRVVGHRDVPGRPAMYATTRQFLDYFNLKSLEGLPPLAEIKDLDNLSGNLPLDVPMHDGAETLTAVAVDDTHSSSDETAGHNGDEASVNSAETTDDSDRLTDEAVANPNEESKSDTDINEVSHDLGDETATLEQAHAEEAPAEEIVSEGSEEESR